MKDLNGISSYGYGYWSRFRLNTPNYLLSTLPQWVAMSRLTNNKDFQDQSKAGDRILTVMLGEENY